MKAGHIVGIVIGAVAGLAIFATIIFCCCCKKAARTVSTPAVEKPPIKVAPQDTIVRDPENLEPVGTIVNLPTYSEANLQAQAEEKEGTKPPGYTVAMRDQPTYPTLPQVETGTGGPV